MSILWSDKSLTLLPIRTKLYTKFTAISTIFMLYFLLTSDDIQSHKVVLSKTRTLSKIQKKFRNKVYISLINSLQGHVFWVLFKVCLDFSLCIFWSLKYCILGWIRTWSISYILLNYYFVYQFSSFRTSIWMMSDMFHHLKLGITFNMTHYHDAVRPLNAYDTMIEDFNTCLQIDHQFMHILVKRIVHFFIRPCSLLP